MPKQKTPGYILLISALIISSVLLAVVCAAAGAGFYLSANGIDMYSRQQSFVLAWSCLQMARLRIIQNPQSPQVGQVPIAGYSCQIFAINFNAPVEGQITIQSRAEINNAVSNLQMVVSAGDLSLISWEDLDSS
jgi:hypothetical protein